MAHVQASPYAGILPADHPLGGGPTPDGGEIHSVSSGWRLALREFTDNRLAVLGLLVLVFFVLFSFVGPLVYHGNTTISNPLNAALIAIVIGTVYGAISGLAGGFLDGLMMRFVDVLLSIPFLFIVLVLATKYNGTVVEISIVLGVFSWLVPARLVRGEVLTLRERDFVSAARVMGGSRTRIVTRHLIPNAMSVTIVNVTFLIADSMLALAYLGALGFGLSYPRTSWGDMLGGAQTYVQNGQWWLVYPVGACLVLVVLACNLVGDALRDALDVRLRRR
jgi:peptide/nickel transport system permease protein